MAAAEAPVLSTASTAVDFEKWYGSFNWTWKGSKPVVKAKAAKHNPEPTKAEPKLEPKTPPRRGLTPLEKADFMLASVRISPPRKPTTRLVSPAPAPAPASPKYFTNEYFEVKQSPKRGLGSFAIIDIAKGTVILSEKPLFIASAVEVYSRVENLPEGKRKEYMKLSRFNELNPHPIMAIFLTNRFCVPNERGQNGIFVNASRFNHACLPKVGCFYEWNNKAGEMVFSAADDIKKGQEITISYGGPPAKLFENYGFWCDCANCPDPAESMKAWKKMKAPDQPTFWMK